MNDAGVGRDPHRDILPDPGNPLTFGVVWNLDPLSRDLDVELEAVTSRVTPTTSPLRLFISPFRGDRFMRFGLT